MMVLPPLNYLLLARSTHAVQLESKAPPRYLLYTEKEGEKHTLTHTIWPGVFCAVSPNR
jgi:hypothetical protein